MTRILLKLGCFFLLFLINSSSYGQIQKIITYNIKYDNPNDSLNKWDNRKMEVVEMLKYYEPDVLGIQEGLEHQLLFLDQQFANYSRIGVGRDDGKKKGEFSPIYYNTNKLTLIKEATFWLSDQEDRVSVGWDASMERICTYGVFENNNNQERVLVLNTHYDHKGQTAREMSSKLIITKIHEINQDNYPIILMGDFNAAPTSKTINLLKNALEDGATLSKNGIYGPKGTYTGFTKNVIANRRIDYIFIKDLGVATYRHIDDKMKNNNYLSDHLPVFLELKY